MGQGREAVAIPADQRAMVDGYTPAAFHAFDPATLPDALVENASAGVTGAMVAAREGNR